VKLKFWEIFVAEFSAVVGPNGSGKSNVIDAMLFVFGKRAKQVRSFSRMFYIFFKFLFTYFDCRLVLADAIEQSFGAYTQFHQSPQFG